ncbi:MAG TPA: isoprenylcysteine carboxylmethyltransferase family protein [Candidatus Aminicenantes bacterium]|nr:isoprenylcysteine carboxylmethyltransferase family protein [Candidatus Aminicenantes bacterium]
MTPRTPLWARSIAAFSVVAALVFFSSGGLDYWQGWVYVAASLAVLGLSRWFLRDDPGLVAERLRPGKGVKWWDKGYFLLATPLFVAAIVVAGVDAGRRHWSDPPGAAVYALALAVFLAGQGLFLWAKKVNPFFSSVARIQTDRGQSVCREGPYRFCRHPGYLGGLMFGLATPLVLGSYWALVPQALASALLVLRTALEDRMLKRDLLWYAEYAAAVPARLIPGIW